MAKVREGYLREGEDYRDDEALFRIARQCARCSKSYPSSDCCSCMYNNASYTEPRRAALLRAEARLQNAEADYWTERWAKTVRRHNSENQRAGCGSVIATAIIVSLLIWGGSKVVAFLQRAQPPVPKVMLQAQQVAYPYSAARVEAALQYVQKWKGDVNWDGETNCQDYALLFQRAYPQAELFYHAPNSLWPSGHLYNRVASKQGWVYIEPQTKPGGVWTMRDHWSGVSPDIYTVGRTAYAREFGWPE
jgi:hypothetical protein